MHIVTLLAGHDMTKLANALRNIQKFFVHRLPEVKHETIVVGSSLDKRSDNLLTPHTGLVSRGSRKCRFAAWDCGLQSLGPRLNDYDFIHLATEDFSKIYVDLLNKFDADMLGLVRGRAVAVGHFESPEEPVNVFGRVIQVWLQSLSIFLPPTELALLGSLITVAGQIGTLNGGPEVPSLGKDRPSGAHVTCQMPVEDSEGKTISLHKMNEYMLTCRLRAQGCNIVDATWLAVRAESSELDARPLLVFPDWQTQISVRNAGLI
jgi:hypothetical protein